MQAAAASRLAPTGPQRADAVTVRAGASVVRSGRLAISNASPSRAAAVRVLMSMFRGRKKDRRTRRRLRSPGTGEHHEETLLRAAVAQRRVGGRGAQSFISLNTHIEPPWFR